MGLQLVTSFINIAKVLSARRETTRRQLDAEKKKGSDGPRVESLDKTYNATHERVTLLEEMMRKVFTGYIISYTDSFVGFLSKISYSTFLVLSGLIMEYSV